MPDVTMCKGGSCPLRESCYRHTAKPGALQSYFLTPPVKADSTCSYFWKVK